MFFIIIRPYDLFSEMVVNGFASVIIVDHDIYDWGLFQRWYNSIILCKQTFKLQDSFLVKGHHYALILLLL